MKKRRFKLLLQEWADFMYEGFKPPLPDPKHTRAIFDWRGCCKYCGKPKEELTKTEWL